MRASSLKSTGLKRSGKLRPRRKTRKGRISVAVLNTLWGQVIRQRDKACRFAGIHLPDGSLSVCAGKIEAAHIYSKKAYPNTRWDEGNGNALCTRHHFFVHQNPVQASRLYQSIWGREHLDSLWIKAIAHGKIDREAVREYLREKLKEYEG